jgi:hypothetical protein
MISESSSNFYYRYFVTSGTELTPATHQRKLKKAQQNTTTHLLIDLTKIKSFKDLNLSLLKDGHQFQLIYHCKPKQLDDLQKNIPLQLNQILLAFETAEDLNDYFSINLKLNGLMCPTTEFDFKSFAHFVKNQALIENTKYFWSFKPYNPRLKKSVTLKSIYQTQLAFKTLKGLEINNTHIPTHYELEPLVDLTWAFATPRKNIQLSIIIPSFNNITFLSNVVQHLIHQSVPAENYEIIIVEDGGTDHTALLLKELLIEFEDEINLKFIYWPKQHLEKGSQNFFRAGLARNLAAQFSDAERLIFLDSDMLVPEDFVEIVLKEL